MEAAGIVPQCCFRNLFLALLLARAGGGGEQSSRPEGSPSEQRQLVQGAGQHRRIARAGSAGQRADDRCSQAPKFTLVAEAQSAEVQKLLDTAL